MSQYYRAPILKKAFSILDLLSKNESGVTITDLGKQLRISKSTVHGIIKALLELGAVVHDPKTKRCNLGLIFLELAKTVYARLSIKDVARPFLEDLSRKAQESVFFGTQVDEHVTILDMIESSQELKITAPIGTRIPLLAGATGKVFLASGSDQAAIKLIHTKKLRKYTDNTIIQPEAYLEEIEKARSNGYALDDEEYIPGVRAVASAIRDRDNQVFSIWVVGFTPRMTNEKMLRIADETRLTAEAIGKKLALPST